MGGAWAVHNELAPGAASADMRYTADQHDDGSGSVKSRERFLACMDFQLVDRVPDWEMGYWAGALELRHAEGLPRHPQSPRGLVSGAGGICTARRALGALQELPRATPRDPVAGIAPAGELAAPFPPAQTAGAPRGRGGRGARGLRSRRDRQTSPAACPLGGRARQQRPSGGFPVRRGRW
jgi:hypothetical protein